MKRNIACLLLLPAFILLPATGCSDGETPRPDVADTPRRIELSATGDPLTAVGKAARSDAFGSTVFATTRQGVYTELTQTYEWRKQATVGADGQVSLPDNPVPAYPANGAWIYLTAVAPEADASAISNGTVTYALTGLNDVLFAGEIRGHKRDGHLFSGNTDRAKDTPLVFGHLLTQLQFEVKKSTGYGVPVTIRKITVKEVSAQLTLSLATGVAVFSAPRDLSLSFSTQVAGTTAVPVGSFLVAPLASSATYKITVDTSIGTFSDIPLTLSGAAADTRFQAGVSHKITLTLEEGFLGVSSVTVAPWTTVPGGELDLID